MVGESLRILLHTIVMFLLFYKEAELSDIFVFFVETLIIFEIFVPAQNSLKL